MHWDLEKHRNIDCSFFFQAEDGIRDIGVTGVQTCALPIYYFCCFCKFSFFCIANPHHSCWAKSSDWLSQLPLGFPWWYCSTNDDKNQLQTTKILAGSKQNSCIQLQRENALHSNQLLHVLVLSFHSVHFSEFAQLQYCLRVPQLAQWDTRSTVPHTK